MFNNAFLRKQPPTFKHFTRKRFAVFASLGREVRIGVLSVSTLTYASLGAFAVRPVRTLSPDTLPSRQLGEASVIGTRAPLTANRVARIVTTITRKDIEGAAAQSVPDLLKQTVGVDVRQRGGFGVQTDISLEGGTFDQITILLNGVTLNSPQTGHLSADFPVGVDDIERIEVLEGAAGRALGTQAFSGAINIVTRAEARSGVSAHADAGSYGTVGAGAALNLRTSAWLNRVSAEATRSDGGTSNSDFKQVRAFYRGGWRDAGLRLDWQAGAWAKDYGANTFYSAAYPNQWEANRRYMLSLTGSTQGRVHLQPTLAWVRSQDHFQLLRGTHTAENFHRTDVFTAALTAWTQWAAGRTAFGAELRQEGILSSNLGRPIDSARFVPIHSQRALYYTHRDNRTNLSFFVEHNVAWGPLTASLGVMANRNTAVDERLRWYPGLDLSLRPGGGWRLFASWNKSLRLPTFTDLYYRSPTQEGNVGLRPEEVNAYRLGAEWACPALSLRATGHYSRGRNMIDWVMYRADDLYHSAAFRLSNYGYSLLADWRPQTMWGEHMPVTRVQLSYAYIYQRRHDRVQIFKSNYALEYLRHKFCASLAHRVWRRLTANWSLRWQQREGGYLRYEGGQSTGRTVAYRPYATLDAKLQWTAPAYTLYVSANNLTSHRYYDLGNIPQPGIWWMAGAKWRMGL